MLIGQHYRGNLMDRDKLKMMVRELKTLVNEIESEVFSDKDKYTQKNPERTLGYVLCNDDDGDPD